MSIINHTHKFIFVHIPKCGGTSVTVELSRLTRLGDLELGGTSFGEAINPAYSKRFGLGKHSSAEEICRLVGEQCWRTYFTFAFVRNPYSRTVSTFKFLKQWRLWEGSEVMDGFDSINEFLASGFWLNSLGPDRILAPQTYFTGASTPFTVKRTWKLENYKPAITELLTEIRVEIKKPVKDRYRNALPKMNAAIDLELSGGSVEKIYNRYQSDFQAFGYEPDISAVAFSHSTQPNIKRAVNTAK